MPGLTPFRLLRLLMIPVIIMGLSSCVVAHQPRAGVYVSSAPAAVVDYDYWYYPDIHVYFDISRGVYFYYSNQRWIQTRVLPTYWRNRLDRHVRIKSRHQRPYLEYKEHLRKFPARTRPRQEYDPRRDRSRNEERSYQRDKTPRYYQEQPRKEPYRYNREERINDAPRNSDSRIKVPANKRHEKVQDKKHDIKAKERGKSRNKYDKDSEGRDQDYNSRDKRNRDDR